MRQRTIIGFVIFLLATTVLWFGVSLSEKRSHTLSFNLQWVGYDSIANVVRYADSTASFTFTANSYTVMRLKHRSRQTPLTLNVLSDTTLKGTLLAALLEEQFPISGISDLNSQKASVSLRLVPRKHKTLVPQLRGVEVAFAYPYALYGTPRIAPDSVVVYGSEESLAAIETISTQPLTIPNVGRTATYSIPLEDLSSRFPDVRLSVSNVSLRLPTQPYVEKSYTLPVSVKNMDDTKQVRLYPETVKVTLWVAECDVERLKEGDLAATVEYNTTQPQWSVSVDRFPAYARVKKVQPSDVQYVVIDL